MAEMVRMVGSDVKPECMLSEELPRSSCCWWYFLQVGAMQALEEKWNDPCLSVTHPNLWVHKSFSLLKLEVHSDRATTCLRHLSSFCLGVICPMYIFEHSL